MVKTKIKSDTRGDNRVCHILTSSEIYDWTNARQHGIYFFYTNTKQTTADKAFFNLKGGCKHKCCLVTKTGVFAKCQSLTNNSDFFSIYRVVFRVWKKQKAGYTRSQPSWNEKLVLIVPHQFKTRACMISMKIKLTRVCVEGKNVFKCVKFVLVN